MKTRRLVVLSALACVALLSIGCQAPGQPAGPTVAQVVVDTPDDYERLFTAAEDVLRSYWLRPDRKDRQQGVITTHRDTTANGFELWRPQPNNAYYWAESNIHTIQRQATVRIRPVDDDPASREISVQVDRRRYSLQERQVDNAAGALRIFSSDAPTFLGRTLYSTAAESTPDGNVKLAESSYWIPLGRDEPMEQEILAQIMRRYDEGRDREEAFGLPGGEKEAGPS